MEKTFTKKVKDEIERHIEKNKKIDFSKDRFDKVNVKKDLRQKFVKYGMIYDPHKGHHLEFNFNNPDIANETIQELSFYDISGRLSISNNKRYIVYIVDAETILRFIKLLGADITYKEYSDILAYNLKVKNTNRQVNFEFSNIKKSSKAAIDQMEVINNILKNKNKYKIDDRIKDLIKARKKYPTISLSELAKKMGITKSALNHRLIKMRNILKEQQI